VLRNSANLGYGGNPKLGYRYAIDAGFDLASSFTVMVNTIPA